MLRHYLMLAGKVFLRRKFFTFISVFGISFTLLVLMVTTAMLDHALAPMAPETRQDRTLGVHWAVMTGGQNTHAAGPGFKLLDRYARSLPGVERLSIYSQATTVDSFVDGRKIQSSLKRTDADFWNILDFSFIEGAPYAWQDVEEARFVAVINRASRARFFGGQPAVGQTLEADGQRFRVIGVVEDVSMMRFIPFADIWVPYTTAKSDVYRSQLVGGFNAIALARDRDALPQIRDEFNSRLLRMEFDDPKAYDMIVAPFGTKFEMFARNSPFANRRDPSSHAWKLQLFLAFLALLFLLLPTVNLININVSRIMERSSEIGIRKAFGASSRVLVGQFVLENVLLTLAGGVFGLALSALVLRAINESGAIRYAQFGVNVRVFLYGLLLTVVFGILSGVYPAWRMSRLHPVDALNGGRR